MRKNGCCVLRTHTIVTSIARYQCVLASKLAERIDAVQNYFKKLLDKSENGCYIMNVANAIP